MSESLGGAAADGRAVQAGAWGGEHIRLQVGEGGAAAEFDCARAEISQPLKLDDSDRFDVTGTFYPERGGPVRRDEQPAAKPARFVGRVSGDEMHLTITLTEEGESLGDFTLVRGREARLFKCY